MPPGVYVKSEQHLAKLREAAARRRGANNPQWKGGRIVVKGGYAYVNVAPDRYVLEHIAVAERTLGRPLPPGAVVHHHNEDKQDNRPCNLVVCPDNAYHRLIHARMRVVKAGGRPDYDAICSACRTVKPLSEFYSRAGGRATYCRPCAILRDRASKARARERRLANAASHN